MKHRYFVLCLLLLPFLGQGQGFYTIFGTQYRDQGLRTFEIPNENAFVVLSEVWETQSWDKGLGISKVDHAGNVVWQKIDASFTKPLALAYREEADGFRVASSHYIGGSGDTIAIRKYNFEGELMAKSTYIVASIFYKPTRLLFLPNGELIALSKEWQDSVYSIIKLSADGNFLWQKDNGDYQYNQFYVRQFYASSNGELIAIGEPFYQDKQPQIIKFDAQGNLLWNTPLPWNFRTGPTAFPLLGNTNYLAWGYDDFSSPSLGTYVGLVNSDGLLVWSKPILPTPTSFVEPNGIIQTEDGNWYMTGRTGLQYFLLKMDIDGNLGWIKYYETNGNYQSPQLLKDSEGNFLIVVRSITDPYVIKTDSEGNQLWTWEDEYEGYYGHIYASITSDNSCLILANGNGQPGDLNQHYLIKIDPNGVVFTNIAQGKLAYDFNGNCAYDSGELPLEGWKIKASDYQRTFYTTTKPDGTYKLLTNGDSLEITMLPPNNLWEVCPDPTYAFFNALYDTVNVEMVGQAVQNCAMLEVDASVSSLRRCLTSTNIYHLTCTNIGTMPTENLKLTVELDSFFILLNSSLPVAAQNGNELIFNINELGVFESIQFTIEVEISCDAELGQVHCLTITASADNECNNGGSRAFASNTECQPNIGSYDPNDKRAFSEGKLVDRFIPADSIIEYQIRFQNTGTDTAFNITVTDTLSSLLDIESIIAGAASHPYRMELEQNNILKFVFQDIMLPDSNINEPASHGFVKFRIRHKPGLVPGDVIPNKAAIYFDFNEAVITNNLELEIKSPTAVRPPKPVPAAVLVVYPQPAFDMVCFELKNYVSSQPYRLEIFNLLGQRIHEQAMKGGVNTVQHLPAGQHFYRLWRNGEMVETGKVSVAR